MNGYSRISGDDDISSRRQPSRSMDEFSETPKAIRSNNKLSSSDHDAGERFGVILGRSASVSSSSSSSLFQRAFSMRRSSSVSERYCRIHDQDTPITTSPPIAIGFGSKKKQRGGANKILKACKRLLRL